VLVAAHHPQVCVFDVVNRRLIPKSTVRRIRIEGLVDGGRIEGDVGSRSHDPFLVLQVFCFHSFF